MENSAIQHLSIILWTASGERVNRSESVIKQISIDRGLFRKITVVIGKEEESYISVVSVNTRKVVANNLPLSHFACSL